MKQIDNEQNRNRNLKITIITVVFNNKEGLEKTIKSVLSQKNKTFEYIVIDGGSTDGTVDVINKYENIIDYWISEPDKGIYDAMNKGAKEATGDYLYFLNSGDYFYDNKVLTKIVNILIKEDIDLVAGRVIALYNDYYVYSRLYSHSKNCQIKMKGWMPSHQGMFVKKTWLEKFGGFDIDYQSAADFDFFCKLYKLGGHCKFVDNGIAYISTGGFGSNKKIKYREKYSIIKKHFGVLYAFVFYFNKPLFEQNLKKILLKLHFKNLYKYLLRIKGKGIMYKYRGNKEEERKKLRD